MTSSAGLAPERRAYHPHITLARWEGRAPGINRVLEQNGGIGSVPWQVNEFILYESRLGQGGAHHEALAEYPLQA